MMKAKTLVREQPDRKPVERGGDDNFYFPFELWWHAWYYVEWRTAETEVFQVAGRFMLARKFLTPPRSFSKAELESVNTRISEARSTLGFLVELAKMGHPGAAEGLVSIVANGCAELSALSAADLPLFRSIARGRFKWPLMKSRFPSLSDPETLLTDLQLGEDLPLAMDPRAKGILDDAGEIALHLLFHVWHVHRWAPKLYSRDVRDELSGLGKFNTDSREQWWKVAKKCFLHSYPKPQEIPELNEMVTATTHRKSAGRIRRSILEMIKARFLSFAPCTSLVAKPCQS